MSFLRPRFRASRRSGRNLAMHPRWSQRQPRQTKNIAPVAPLGLRLFRNEDVFGSSLLPLTADLVQTRLRLRRVRRNLKALYGASNQACFDRLRNQANQLSPGISLLAPWETRAEVLLQRSSLASTRGAARQRITSGRVTLSVPSVPSAPSTQGLQHSRLRDPGYQRQPGEVLSLSPSYWSTLGRVGVNQTWEQVENTQQAPKAFPPYREVDLEQGALVLLFEPTDGSVRVPAGLELAKSSFASFAV